MKKTYGKRKRIWCLFAMLLAVALLAVACGTAETEPNLSGDERDRFSVQWESADGVGVFWSGYSNGYAPGEEFALDVTISNNSAMIQQGRYCFLLMDPDVNAVIATLAQHDYRVDSGMSVSRTIHLTLPTALDDGMYGLFMPVRKADGDTADMIAIQVGEGAFESIPAGEDAMDAAIAACPPRADEADRLAEMSVMVLAEQLGMSPGEIEMIQVEMTDFPDASLGVPEPGMDYAQVITPGYIITLEAAGRTYRYHGANDRVVAVPDEAAASASDIVITGVQVADGSMTVRGQSSLPNGACLGSELWADGEMQTWWPGEECIEVQAGNWIFTLPLGEGSQDVLDERTQYMLRVFLQGGADIVSVFAFDLAAPPMPDLEE